MKIVNIHVEDLINIVCIFHWRAYAHTRTYIHIHMQMDAKLKPTSNIVRDGEVDRLVALGDKGI